MPNDIATSVSLGDTDAYVAYNSIRKTLPLGFAGPRNAARTGAHRCGGIEKATGLALANHEMTVIAVAGDGDCYGEGGNHLLHAIRRNVNVTLCKSRSTEG